MQLNILQTTWKRIINAGIEEGMPFSEAKFFLFTNYMSVIAAVGIAGYIPYSIVSGNYALAIIQAADVLAVMGVILLNLWGSYTAARFTYIIVINSLVLINSCYIGYESKMHEFFYLTNIIPFFVFPIKQVKNICMGMFCALAGFGLYYYMYPYFEAYNLSVSDQVSISYINSVVKFVLFAGSIFVLAWYNTKSENTLADSNGKLSEYARDLERSNSDLENFAYVISHDLKAPVRNITSLLQLYIKRHAPENEAGGEFLQISLTSSQRLTKLIEDMLAYSRIGKNLPTESTVDTNQVINTIKLELSERIKDTNALVVIARPLPTLYRVHSSMMYHVFQNLITNGIKFNKSETPTVIISHEDAGTHYRFKVQDNGIGIKSENRKGLFNMFRRLHTAEEYEGTGIGLAICKRVVGLYNGKIWIESEYGAGTTFYFDIEKAGVVNDQLIHQIPAAKAIAV